MQHPHPPTQPANQLSATLTAILDRRASHPNLYCWYLLVATLDVVLTFVILSLNGVELNPLADHLWQRGDLWGLVFLKYTSVALVIGICEYLAYRSSVAYRDVVRSRFRNASRHLAWCAIAISMFPVIVAISELAHAAYTHL